MTTLQVIVAQIILLPRIFDWVLAPVTLITLPFAFTQKTRSAALVGFLTIAALCLSLVSVAAASIVYAGWRFGHMAFDLLISLGPSATLDFLVSLLRVTGVRPIDFAPVIATTLASSTGAVALSWNRSEAGRFQRGLGPLVPPSSTAARR